jgi:hypothetical protein
MLKTDLRREQPACWDQLGKTYPLGHSSLCNKNKTMLTRVSYTAKNQYRKFETNISRQQSRFIYSNNPSAAVPFPHSCVCERFILYIQTIHLQPNLGLEYTNRSQTHECGNCMRQRPRNSQKRNT